MLLLPFPGCFFPFKRLFQKVLIWSVFTLLVASSFLLAAFSLTFVVFAVNLCGKWKLRMRPIRFNTCKFCCIYLLNNRNLECRHAIRRVYTCSFSTLCCKRIDSNIVHAFASFSWLLFSFETFVQKSIDLKCFHAFGSIFLFAGCLFLESFQFLQSIWPENENLECDILGLTLASFAVLLAKQ